jgi:hypothetical protein
MISKCGCVINKFGVDVARSIADQTLGKLVLFNLILFSPMEDEQHMGPSPRRPLLAQGHQCHLNPIYHPPLPLPLTTAILREHGPEC